MLRISDELRQSPGPDPMWADTWEIDFAQADGLGGFVRLALYPNLGVAWWWSYLLTPRLVAVRDHEVPLPRTGLAVRADGLWADLECETPLEHWSIGLEAFGIAFDEPAEAWADEWGERLPVGLDLEWEAGSPAAEVGEGYAQPGRVVGELLVGSARLPFDGQGFKWRSSGRANWWEGEPRHRSGFCGTGGAAAAFGVPSGRGSPGGVRFLPSNEILEIGTVDVRGRFDQAGLPTGATYGLEDRTAEATVVGVAPVLLTGPGGRRARLARALCRLEGGEGSSGVGWAEWLRR